MALNYKIVLVGDGGCGKSTWIKRLRTGEFEKKYIATQGVDVSCLTFNTNYGPVVFKVWDCAGQEKFGGLRDGYYQEAKGAIIMFDLTSKFTLANVPNWLANVTKVTRYIPVIICGNKSDIEDGRIDDNHIYHSLPNVEYYQISARSNYNIEKPFLDLARQLTGHEDLVFIESEPVIPPEVQVTPELLEVRYIKVPGGKIKVTHEFIADL